MFGRAASFTSEMNQNYFKMKWGSFSFLYFIIRYISNHFGGLVPIMTNLFLKQRPSVHKPTKHIFLQLQTLPDCNAPSLCIKSKYAREDSRPIYFIRIKELGSS